ncbi:hypothetical protein Q0M94_02180 [Deinococcus radiomollis]|uniref:hypothetical protein n=1 Tax=Deinococcus radiomollis TaxID=468916 RepID=UPI0038915AD2
MIELAVTGSIDAMLASLDRHMPQVISEKLNVLWAADAEKKLKEKYAEGGGGNYYTLRSGASRNSVRATVTPTGAELSVSGPGVQANEYGATITAKAGNWLTFRLFNPGDTTQATGNWVRVRQVVLKPKHAVRDSAEEALAELQIHLNEVLLF